MPRLKVLILGGTAEGRELAQALVARGCETVTSLAGATRSPAHVAGQVRIGGYGDSQAYADFIREGAFDAVIDATHPFAAKMSKRASIVAQQLRIRHLQILRDPWRPVAGDQWYFVEQEQDVSDLIERPAIVFLATGRQTLSRFSNLADCQTICRQIDPPSKPYPFANGRYLVGRPPFSVEDERALFTSLGVDWLVVKNAGGAASMTKLVAARELGIGVAMINRPPAPDCERVSNVADALVWLGLT